MGYLLRLTLPVLFLCSAVVAFSQPSENTRAKPFKIAVAENVLTDLQVRLKQTRWTDKPQNAGWSYDANPQYLFELVNHRQNRYDWRQHEAALNRFPRFKAEINSITIHFAYVKGKGRNPKPLLLTHGWPDSFYRFYKVIPRLTDPASAGGDPAQSFDIVVPSIPGFGFSDPVALTDEQTASLWANLMTDVLGYRTLAVRQTVTY